MAEENGAHQSFRCGSYGRPCELFIEEIPPVDEVAIIECVRCEEVIGCGDHDFEENPVLMKQCPNCDIWHKIEYYPGDTDSSYSHNMAVLGALDDDENLEFEDVIPGSNTNTDISINLGPAAQDNDDPNEVEEFEEREVDSGYGTLDPQEDWQEDEDEWSD